MKLNKENRPLTRSDLEAVVSHLPALRDAINSRTGEKAADHEYSDEFRSVVRAIVNEFHERPFLYAFDYMSWIDEAKRLTDDPQTLAATDLETIRKLLVVHWRSDYWDTDNEHWEHIAGTGHLTALLERIEELAKKMEPSQDNIEWDDKDAEGSDIRVPVDSSHNVWPTVEELMAGFNCIRDKITPQQLKMLQVNYHSGGRAVTMRELATATGYGDYRIVNGQYGGLAKRLYKAIGYPAPIDEESGKPFWILGLGDLIDRRRFGLEMHCVMRPEVAEALERLEIVERLESDRANEELDVPNAAYASDVEDLSEILSSDDADIQDFIVYHNPDAMGPLEPGDGFGVVTNRGLGSATIGDRVWLIIGEGTPRKYFLASWFYIDEFSSGEDKGLKHAIVGKNGQNFDPFIEIEQDEWFTQLKQDQGNFAFGFSRITTPGAVEGLKQLAGFNDRYLYIPNPAGKVDRIDESTVRAIRRIVRWIPDIERAMGQLAENGLDETIAGLLRDLDAADLSLKDPDGTWLTYASAFATGYFELPKGDLHALRAALTWHTAGLRESGYWREIARNGELMKLLRGFEDCLQFHEERGDTSESK